MEPASQYQVINPLLDSVFSTPLSEVLGYQKKKAVPRLSNQFKVLSEIKRKEKSSSHTLKSVPSKFRNKKEKKKAVPGVSNHFRVLSEIKRKRKKQFPESQISSEYVQK